MSGHFFKTQCMLAVFLVHSVGVLSASAAAKVDA